MANQFCQSELQNFKQAATDDNEKTLLDCLTRAVNKQISAKEKASKSASEFVSKIGEGVTLVSSITQSFKNSQIQLAKFLKDYQAQYRLGEDIAKSYKKLSVNIGIGYQNQELLGKSFQDSLIKVRELGGDFEDVNAIYTKFADQSGRVRVLDDEEVQRIFAIEKATGLMGDSAAALAERFDLVGIGSEDFSNNIEQVMKDSQKMGLNSSKVVKVLSDNFESMQRMSFRGGVKAMTEMSKLAVKMRMDIGDMLGMADKFYEPEAAIEAAAQMQLLGGDIANAFGDPIQMMYEARNAPEEFMKRVGGATEGMVKFNEESGQFDMVAENRQKLMGMADALGINKDKLIDTAFQMSKMKKIKMDVGGNLFDEDTMDKIASIAKFDKTSGQWTVDVAGDEIAVKDLDASQIEKALASPTTEKDAIMETAKASMTTNQLLGALVKSNEAAIVRQTRVYEALEKGLDPLIKSTSEADKKIVEGLGDAIKESQFGQKLDDVVDLATLQFQGAADGIEYLTKALERFKKLNPLEGEKTGLEGRRSEGGGAPPEQDFVWREGSASPISFTEKDTLLGAKKDGPIDKLINNTISTPSISNISTNQKLDVSGTINFGNINITMDGSSENISFTEQDKKEMMKTIKTQIIAGVNGMIGANKVSGKDSLMMG
jgi:hypothetical protein